MVRSVTGHVGSHASASFQYVSSVTIVVTGVLPSVVLTCCANCTSVGAPG